MITYRELREISLSFRRLSSNLLGATMDNADALLRRFKKYIDETPFINGVIHSVIDEVEYSYTECFISGDCGDWSSIRIPADENCHVKAMYDYITKIVESNETVYRVSSTYYYDSRKINENIQSFFDEAFKPLIDFINDAISKEMILQEEERRGAPGAMTQNIGMVYGNVNQQGSGSIVSYNTINTSSADIVELINRIIPSLLNLQGADPDEVDEVRDDLESIAEQISSNTPKKNRIQKAISRVKKFVRDVLNKAAVTYVAGTITDADWTNLIQQVETFLEMIR